MSRSIKKGPFVAPELMDICICTTAKTDEEAKELLSLIGAPFYA